MQSTTLNRNWLLKIGGFAVLFLGFGVYAVVDATWLYPRRGLADASAKLGFFLASADKAGLLRPDKIQTPDPRATLNALNAKAADLRRDKEHDNSEGRAAQMEVDRLEWLEALHRAWKLDASPKFLGKYDSGADNALVHKKLTFNPATGMGTMESRAKGGPVTTTELNPQSLLSELNAFAAASPKAAPLSAWDLPMQWSFVAVGFGLGGYLLLLVARCAATARKIQFDDATQRLTLENGVSFTPADIQDVDKRLWHKLYVVIITNDGVHHKLDLLRYVPLEEWVLAMEHTRFPERAEEDKVEEEAAEQDLPVDDQPTGAENPAA
jgi:hypothetical protein